MSKLSDFFIQKALALCEKYNVDVNIIQYDDERDAYLALVEAGIDQDDIINFFESAINLTFVDVREKPLCISAIKNDRLEELVKFVKVYPFEDGNMLKVAISNPEQMEYTENIMSATNYSFVFSFQFLIDEELDKINLDDDVERGLEHAEKSLTKINADRRRIILATGQDDIDEIIEHSDMFSDSYIPIAKIQNRELLMEYCENDTPDILLLGDNIGGKTPLTELLLRLHAVFPEMRIIYLCGDVDAKDNVKKMMLGSLASAGIYDLITKSDISILLLKNILDNPYTEIDVKEWLTYMKDSAIKKKSTITLYVPDTVETDNSVTIYPNLYTFTSSKGGVGKTFIIEQLAIAIATCGVQRTNGTKPRVGIIDLDFQGFGVSKFFNTLNEKENIFGAMEAVGRVIDDLGENKNPGVEIEREVNELIHKSFKQSSKYSNIRVLGGTDRLYHAGDKELINKYMLTYIVETVIDDFDVLLVDGNTDMDAKAIYPLYSLSNYTYFVLDMDWGTFHNNKRFLMYLEEEQLFIPTQSKFVLNKAIADDELYVGVKDIEAGIGATFSNIFPRIKSSVIFNMSSKSENVIQSQEKNLAEEKYYFLKMANDIYPILNFDILSANFDGKTTFKISKRAIKEAEKNKKKREEELSCGKDKKNEKKEKTSLTDGVKKFVDGFKFKKATDNDFEDNSKTDANADK